MDQHRVFCGSALDTPSYYALLAGEKAQLVFTDPPYNLQIHGHVGGLGAIKHREFAMASGEMTDAAFVEFLEAGVRQIQATSRRRNLLYLHGLAAHRAASEGSADANVEKPLCLGQKQRWNGVALSISDTSLCLFSNVAQPITSITSNLANMAATGRTCGSTEGPTVSDHGRDDLLKSHPTVKPVALVADAIKDCSRRGDLILDPFAGSGTTIIAAEKTKRRSALIEIDPLYVDVIVRRWQAFTGKQAVCATTAMTFAQREALREPRAPQGDIS